MNKFIRFGTGFGLTLLFSSLLCLFLYQYNNKYTHSSVQPHMGQLVLSEDDLGQVHFLIHDWEFYPDILLTPESLKQDNSPYMVYTSIGDRTRFGNPEVSKTSHGQGSYRLQLWLPAKKLTYSLELPEIFSAYTLYIDGEHILTMGDPSPGTYEARTKTTTITFQAEGSVELLLAVSNYSHFYSGVVYPPVLGMPDLLTLMQNVRLIFTMIQLTLGVLFFLFAILVGITLKKNTAFLFSLLCLTMSCVIFFPLLHTLLELSVSPWYAMELICIYLMTFLVLLLHNRICHIPPLPGKISFGISLCILIIAGVYGLLSAHLTTQHIKLFSQLVAIYKQTVAIYLLITALHSLKEENIQTCSLFFGCIAYGCFFLWDRILPSYEPIYLGWFQDWGNLIMTLSIGYILARDLIYAQINQLTFAENYRQIEKQLIMQKEYAHQLNIRGEENRKLTHDFKHHLRIISQMAEQIESNPETIDLQEKLMEYLRQVVPQFSASAPLVPGNFSQNNAVNALFQYYDLRSQEEGISTDLRLQLPEVLPLSDIELCTMLGNLLENAIEACCRLPANQKRFIRLSCQIRGQLWFFCLENSYDGIVEVENGRFFTHKKNSHHHGIGLQSVRSLIEQYDGNIDFYPLEEVFRVGITLPF